MSRRPPSVADPLVDGAPTAPVELAVTRRSRSRGLLGRSHVEGAVWFPAVSRAAAATLVVATAAACGPPAPDRLETSYVGVEVGEASTLTLPQGEASMWADAGSADTVTCWASGPEEASRTELLGHSRDLRVPAPVTRDGQEFLTVGKLPPGPGEVTVECTGPAGAALYAAISRAPE